MPSFKLIFVAALAIFAVGSEASRVRRSPNLFEVIERIPNFFEKIIKNISEAWNTTIKKLEAFVKSVLRTVRKSWNIFNTEIFNVAKCSNLPKPEVKGCINKEIDKSLLGIAEIATDIVFIMTNSVRVFKPIIREMFFKPFGLLIAVLNNGKPLIDKIYQFITGF